MTGGARVPEHKMKVEKGLTVTMRDGVRILNVARGGLIDEDALKDALDSGKVGGAALDVFPSEPVTEHPLFGYPNVIVTPHLGASTAEATDRAGYQSAEQVVAALTGGVVSTAVNIPATRAEDMEVLGPFLPLATQLGRLAMELAEGSSVERIEAAFLGGIAAERDAYPLFEFACDPRGFAAQVVSPLPLKIHVSAGHIVLSYEEHGATRTLPVASRETAAPGEPSYGYGFTYGYGLESEESQAVGAIGR